MCFTECKTVIHRTVQKHTLTYDFEYDALICEEQNLFERKALILGDKVLILYEV